MSKIVFIKSATEVASVDSNSFSHAEYYDAGIITLYFEIYRGGALTTLDVRLNVIAGLEQEALRDITLSLSKATYLLFSDIDLTSTKKNYKNEVITEPASHDSKYVTSIYSITYGGATPPSDVTTLYVTVRNTSGGTLLKGTPVHAVDVTGEVADVIAARADDPTAMPATYVLNEDVDNNAQGQAIIVGVIEGVDTSSFSPGDVVYVASTGGFTNVKPTGTNLIQNLGVVTKSNANTGSGVVLGAGRANDVPNIPENYIWVGNASGVATPTDYTTLKSKQIYSQAFIGDPATTQYYLPWKDINEQTTIYQEEAAMIMPYSGRIVSTEVRVSALTVSTGDITISIHTCPTGLNQFTAGNWTVEETETLTHTVVSSYYHTFHFVFDNAQHFEAGDLVAIGYLQSADLGGTSYYYVTTVVEYDYTNTLGSTSTEHGSNP